MEALVNEVLAAYAGTPSGMIRDADTVLADIMSGTEYEVSGIALELLHIYKGTDDKKAFLELFELMSGVPFIEYLDMCLAETTAA